MAQLTGLAALVTGSAGGTGRGIAFSLVRENAKVARLDIGLPSAVNFSTTSELDDTFLVVGTGIDIFATARTLISLNGFSQFFDTTDKYGGSAMLAIWF